MQKKAISVKDLYAMPIDELAKLEKVTVQGPTVTAATSVSSTFTMELASRISRSSILLIALSSLKSLNIHSALP